MELKQFKELLEVITKLRHPKTGCPWDIKQTHISLLKYLIEESYEFIEVANNNDHKKMEEELGDILLQILLHAKIGEESNNFTLESISKVLADKMIRRHPHVFDKDHQEKLDADGVVKQWVDIKREEKGNKSNHRIDKSCLHFPALFSANKIGEKTNKIKFDWDNADDVVKVVESEWKELKKELKTKNNQKHIEEEFGDLLFSMAQLGRHLKINPEISLRKANEKFLRRFNKMETLIEESNKTLEDMDQKEMDVYWDKVKEVEKKDET